MKMRRSIEIEIYVLYASASLSALIAVLDVFGLLDRLGFPALASRVPIVTLLLLSLACGTIAGIWRRQEVAEQLIRELLTAWRSDTVERIAALRRQISPSLEAVFGDQISEMLVSLTSAINDQRIDLYDLDLFRFFYKRTLEAFPHATFLATSLPYQRYFWRNPPIEDAIARFVADGGKMQRIFLIYDPAELRKSEVKEVMQRQVETGVDVYISDARKIPTNLRRLFVVEEEGRIAWEVNIGPDSRINRVIATSDPASIASYQRTFKELFELAETKPYPGP
jgi:hypothetical protein